MDAITCLSIPIEANSNSSTAERKNARKGTVKAKGERYIALLTPTGKSHWFFHGHIRDFDSKGCCVPTTHKKSPVNIVRTSHAANNCLYGTYDKASLLSVYISFMVSNGNLLKNH